MDIPSKSVKVIALSEKDKNNALKLIDDILHSMSFFRENIAGWELPEDEVNTFMSLFESYFKDLAPLVGYDSVLVQERKDRYKKIRDLNSEISRMRSESGKNVTPDQVMGFLKNCDDIVRAWYGSYGIHYASQEKFTFWGVVYEFSDELDYDADDGFSSMKNLAEKMAKGHDIITEQDGWDVFKDKFHGTLLDTDKNKKKMQELLCSDFPNCDIREFKSRKNDYGSYSVRITVYFPFTDIFELGKRYGFDEKKGE